MAIYTDDCFNMHSATALDIIKDSPYTFYLGGSRKMHQRLLDYLALGYSSLNELEPGTDYDFYCTWSAEIEEYLKSIGFKCTKGHGASYMDSEMVAILELDNVELVQVVLRKDAEFYRQIFDNIPVEFYYNYLWKSSPVFNGDRLFISSWFESAFKICRTFKSNNPDRIYVMPGEVGDWATPSGDITWNDNKV